MSKFSRKYNYWSGRRGDTWTRMKFKPKHYDYDFSSDMISSTTDMPQEYIHQKRHFGDRSNLYGEPPAKRPAPSIRVGAGFKWNLQALANAADAVESGGKSPVSALNELGVRVVYSVAQQGGPAHCPSFTGAVTVADMTFEGWGHSKREARASAARACLSALLARAGRVLAAPPAAMLTDFTSDEPAHRPTSEFQCLETKMRPSAVNNLSSADASPESIPSPASASPSTALFGATTSPAVHKSPINVLYETYPGLTFNCTFGDGSPLDAVQAPLQLSHSMRFKVVCCIKDQKFEGYGSSKKLAKLAAARSALAVLDAGRVEAPPSAALAGALPQTIADHIGRLVNEKFNEVMRGDLVHSKRKVLAGIVITINNRVEDAKVIAVTTGTKCVSGEHMSVRGRSLNDTHAEVAARRCLQRHLYSQLLMYASAANPRATIPHSDIEPVPGGGYQLKPSRQVHLYVSTAPCGDGRIFSPHEQPEPEPDRHPNRLARGQLRTKIESGEGTIPVKNSNNVLQTWDGVMQGERLLTMSCSDKVARWCVVGLQGALLARLLRPVYLHSLVLGSLLHPHHMYRAICGRIEAYIASLPPPFQLQRPLLARAASTEARTPARAPSFSVCWCSTTPLPEIVNATTGKLESGQPSLLCKQSMFARWQYLVKRLPLLPEETPMGTEPATLPEDLDHLLYNEAKQLCPSYQTAKEKLIEAFEKAKLGKWVKKPLEQDQFVCEILEAEPTALFAWADPALEYSAVQVGSGGVVGDKRGESDDKDNDGEVVEFDEDFYWKGRRDNGFDGYNDDGGVVGDDEEANGGVYVVDRNGNENDGFDMNVDGHDEDYERYERSGVANYGFNEYAERNGKRNDFRSYGNGYDDIEMTHGSGSFGKLNDYFEVNGKAGESVALYDHTNYNNYNNVGKHFNISDKLIPRRNSNLGNNSNVDQCLEVNLENVNFNCDSKLFNYYLRNRKVNNLSNKVYQSEGMVSKNLEVNFLPNEPKKGNEDERKKLHVIKTDADINAAKPVHFYTSNDNVNKINSSCKEKTDKKACSHVFHDFCKKKYSKYNTAVIEPDKENCIRNFNNITSQDSNSRNNLSIDVGRQATDEININITIGIDKDSKNHKENAVEEFNDPNRTTTDDDSLNKTSRIDRLRKLLQVGRTSKIAIERYVKFINNNDSVQTNDNTQAKTDKNGSPLDDVNNNIKNAERLDDNVNENTKRYHILNLDLERISNVSEDKNSHISVGDRSLDNYRNVGCNIEAETIDVKVGKLDTFNKQKYKTIVEGNLNTNFDDVNNNCSNDKRNDLDTKINNDSNNNSDMRESKNLTHMNYLINRLKNMKISNNGENFATDTANLQESDIAKTKDHDSSKSVKNILLHDSKVKLLHNDSHIPFHNQSQSNEITLSKGRNLHTDSINMLESDGKLINESDNKIPRSFRRSDYLKMRLNCLKKTKDNT